MKFSVKTETGKKLMLAGTIGQLNDYNKKAANHGNGLRLGNLNKYLYKQNNTKRWWQQ